MSEYNKKLRATINQLKGLREVYMQNLGSQQLSVVIARLDREGRIIASNLRGEMLQMKLAELFNN